MTTSGVSPTAWWILRLRWESSSEGSMSSLRTLDGVEVRGKRVLIRCDFNVPVEDGKVTDRTRITRSAPTVREIADEGGKAILISHFGRPKERNEKDSLKPLVPVIADVLG